MQPPMLVPLPLKLRFSVPLVEKGARQTHAIEQPLLVGMGTRMPPKVVTLPFPPKTQTPVAVLPSP